MVHGVRHDFFKVLRFFLMISCFDSGLDVTINYITKYQGFGIIKGHSSLAYNILDNFIRLSI